MFKEYERKVLRLLASGVLSPEQLEALERDGEFVGYDYTGSGYFLTVRHAGLPEGRVVCDRPFLTGSADGVTCGFIIFIEHGELTLECHTWGEIEVPEWFRDREVLVAAT